MEYRTLGNTGLKVSILGFGAAPLGDEYGKLDSREAQRAVHYAIDHGINFFDTAVYYGRTLSETRLGEALQGRRDQVIVATKCARFDTARFDFSAECVFRTAEASLRRLRTDYLDILHVHDIEFGDLDQVIQETVPALRKLQETGKIRFAGVTGLQLGALRRVAEETGVDCVLSYCRYTLVNRDLDGFLTPLASERGLGLINASPLGMRLLTEQGPPPWHPATPAIREASRGIVDLCRSRGVPVTDVALQYSACHPYAASTCNGFSTVAEVQANLRALAGNPDPALLAEIDRIAAPVQHVIWGSGRRENWDPMAVPPAQ